MTQTQMAKRAFRYLSFVAYKTNLVNAQLRFKVHEGKIGPPVLTLVDWNVSGPGCTCPNLREIITRRINSLIRLRHGFGDLVVCFGKLKLDAITFSPRYFADEFEEFGDLLDPDWNPDDDDEPNS